MVLNSDVDVTISAAQEMTTGNQTARFWIGQHFTDAGILQSPSTHINRTAIALCSILRTQDYKMD